MACSLSILLDSPLLPDTEIATAVKSLHLPLQLVWALHPILSDRTWLQRPLAFVTSGLYYTSLMLILVQVQQQVTLMSQVPTSMLVQTAALYAGLLLNGESR